LAKGQNEDASGGPYAGSGNCELHPFGRFATL